MRGTVTAKTQKMRANSRRPIGIECISQRPFRKSDWRVADAQHGHTREYGRVRDRKRAISSPSSAVFSKCLERRRLTAAWHERMPMAQADILTQPCKAYRLMSGH